MACFKYRKALAFSIASSETKEIKIPGTLDKVSEEGGQTRKEKSPPEFKV